MAEIKTTLLNSGIPYLLQSNVDFFGVDLDSFRIGDAFGFEVDPDEVSPRGNITYTGARDSLKLKTFNDGKSLRLSLLIPEQYNEVNIGNIVVYALYKGVIKPFVSLVLSELIIKRNPSTEITDQNYKYPANRLVINITISYFSDAGINTDYTINIITPNYANLPYFGKDTDVPLVSENPYSQFIVNEMEALGGLPAFVTKDQDTNSYFASPMFQNIASPKFGVLNSFKSDLHDGSRVTWVWGQTYETPDDSYRGIIGGMSYEDTGEDYLIIGGLSYEDS